MMDGNTGPNQYHRGFQVVTSNRNATDLFACRWLRAPATTENALGSATTTGAFVCSAPSTRAG